MNFNRLKRIITIFIIVFYIENIQSLLSISEIERGINIVHFTEQDSNYINQHYWGILTTTKWIQNIDNEGNEVNNMNETIKTKINKEIQILVIPNSFNQPISQVFSNQTNIINFYQRYKQNTEKNPSKREIYLLYSEDEVKILSTTPLSSDNSQKRIFLLENKSINPFPPFKSTISTSQNLLDEFSFKSQTNTQNNNNNNNRANNKLSNKEKMQIKIEERMDIAIILSENLNTTTMTGKDIKSFYSSIGGFTIAQYFSTSSHSAISFGPYVHVITPIEFNSFSIIPISYKKEIRVNDRLIVDQSVELLQLVQLFYDTILIEINQKNRSFLSGDIFVISLQEKNWFQNMISWVKENFFGAYGDGSINLLYKDKIDCTIYSNDYHYPFSLGHQIHKIR